MRPSRGASSVISPAPSPPAQVEESSDRAIFVTIRQDFSLALEMTGLREGGVHTAGKGFFSGQRPSVPGRVKE
jgi:hypothetical protein